jgi:hypothetical protein
MIDVLKMLEAGDLMSCSVISSSTRVILGAYSNSFEWVVILKDYTIVFIYNISENVWSYRSGDLTVLRPCNGVVFYKKLDQSTVRDLKLNEVLG